MSLGALIWDQETIRSLQMIVLRLNLAIEHLFVKSLWPKKHNTEITILSILLVADEKFQTPFLVYFAFFKGLNALKLQIEVCSVISQAGKQSCGQTGRSAAIFLSKHPKTLCEKSLLSKDFYIKLLLLQKRYFWKTQ